MPADRRSVVPARTFTSSANAQSHKRGYSIRKRDINPGNSRRADMRPTRRIITPSEAPSRSPPSTRPRPPPHRRPGRSFPSKATRSTPTCVPFRFAFKTRERSSSRPLQTRPDSSCAPRRRSALPRGPDQPGDRILHGGRRSWTRVRRSTQTGPERGWERVHGSGALSTLRTGSPDFSSSRGGSSSSTTRRETKRPSRSTAMPRTSALRWPDDAAAYVKPDDATNTGPDRSHQPSSLGTAY